MYNHLLKNYRLIYEMVVVFIDIDRVLAGDFIKLHLEEYNRLFNLELSDQQIEEYNQTQTSIYNIPEIMKYRVYNEKKFIQIVDKVKTNKELYLKMPVIPGSIDGVNDLLDRYNFGGYTTERPLELRNVTKQWLRTNGFPHWNNVIMCNSIYNKLEKIVDTQVDHVILIDHNLKSIIKAKEKMEDHLIKNLLIFAYGNHKYTNELDDNMIYVLDSWNILE